MTDIAIATGWTKERVALLRKLVARKLSAEQIAFRLGGISRNAVIGKMRRLNIHSLRAPTRPTNGHAATRRTPKKPIPEEFVMLETIESTDLPPDQSPFACTLMELTERTCRFPIGDPHSFDFRFCGADHDPACGPYCARHHAMFGMPLDFPDFRSIMRPPGSSRLEN
jgi:GcrA cell cycle regulator